MRVNNMIEKWILETLSKPNKIFNNLPPCPFAKKSWLDGRVKIIFDTNVDFTPILRDEYDLFIFSPTDLSEDSFEHVVVKLREELGDEYVVLDDHPNHSEEVDGFSLNFGYPLIFIQARKKLNEAREELKRMGYYKNWDEEYYKEVTEL